MKTATFRVLRTIRHFTVAYVMSGLAPTTRLTSCLDKVKCLLALLSDCLEPTNALFLCLYALKWLDLVHYKTVKIIYKVYNNLLPDYSEAVWNKRYSIRTRGIRNVQKQQQTKKNSARTNMESRCLFVKRTCAMVPMRN